MARLKKLKFNNTSYEFPVEDVKINTTSIVSNGVATIPVDSSVTASSTNLITSGAVSTAVDGKQDALVSGTNIKTINNTSILGSGNINTNQVSDTAYGSSWDGVTGTAPSKNAVYYKISAMDTTISGKAEDSSVVKLTGNQTVAGTKTFSTSPVVPSKTTDVANTGTAIATEAQVYKILPTVMTASEYSQVSNPVAGKIYFIKES